MDKVLKQRLVGATILIALAVIFLPMLFDDGGEESIQRELALDLPERPDSDQREIRRLPLDPDQARQPPPETAAEPPEESSSGEQPVPDDIAPDAVPVPSSESEPVEPEPAVDSEAQPDAVQESGEEEPPDEGSPDARAADQPRESEPDATGSDSPEPAETADAGGRWVVQVAVFSTRDTAQDIRQRLEELGHDVVMDVIVRDQAELFRLRTGPYAGAETAERARQQIVATIAGVDPVVRELDREGAASERAGFAVQVGSFASRNNAERLVGQLRSQDFDAFMHGEESGGRTIWRVRVGSFETREPAETLLATLRDQAGLEGIVVSHP